MFAFTEGDIRSLATSQSFARGQSYYRSGAVSALTLRGDQLTARVAGSGYEPYRVNVALDQDGRIASASCTCPYDWGGYCKHIVAVLLAALHEVEIEVRPDLETLLADLTADQLRSLVLALAAEHPELIETIDEEVEGLQAQPAPTAPAAASVVYDLIAIRREMRKDFRNAVSSARRAAIAMVTGRTRRAFSTPTTSWARTWSWPASCWTLAMRSPRPMSSRR